MTLFYILKLGLYKLLYGGDARKLASKLRDKKTKQDYCKVFGHMPCYAQQARFRDKTNKSWYNRKGGSKRSNARIVHGSYTECVICGKKLTNWQRWWYYNPK